jgi:hypothetical protein
MEVYLFEKLDEGVTAFINGSTIDEVRAMWGFGRNKTIKILKNELGELRYAEIARITSKTRRNVASVKVNKGRKRGPMPEERRKKIAASHVGIRHSHETRERISKSLKKRIEEVGPLRTKESLIAGAAKGRETKLRNGYYEIFSQKMRGRRRKMSEIAKERMRMSKIRFHENGGSCWMKGKTHSQETREKLSNFTVKMWKSGAFDRGNGLWRSRLEENVYEYLSTQFNCCHSFRIENFIFDIFIPYLNLLIEVNGDYWHFNPAIYSHDHYDKHRNITAKEVWQRDQIKAEMARKNGYNFCSIWEKNIIQNFQGAIDNAISSFKGEDRQWETNTPA